VETTKALTPRTETQL